MESKAKAIGKRADTIEYLTWIAELKKRYRATQIKAAVAVNSALIEFYWNLGRDIGEKYARKGGLWRGFLQQAQLRPETFHSRVAWVLYAESTVLPEFL